MAGRLHYVGGVLLVLQPRDQSARGVRGWPQIRRGAVWLACQFGVAGVATRLCCVEGVTSLIGHAAGRGPWHALASADWAS